MDTSGVAGAAAVFAAGALYYGIGTLYVAIVYARYGVVHYPALILGALQAWAGGGLALAAGTLLQAPPHLPDFTLLAIWTGAMCCACLGILFSRQTDVDPELQPEAKRVGLGVLLPMIAGAVVTLGIIAFYARI